MRRSSARSSGTGMPVAVSRSVGSTSVSSSSGGSIVGRASSTLTMPHTLHSALHMSPSRNAPAHAPGRCWPRCSSAPTRRGCRPRCSCAPARCSASPRARSAPRCPAWSRPARSSREDGGYALGGPPGRPAATAGRQPPGRRPRRGTARGSWPRSTATTRAPPPIGPRCATRSRALRLAELREGVWGRPDNLDPDALARCRAVVDDVVHLLARARAPDPRARRRRGAVGPRRVGGRGRTSCARRDARALLRAARGRRRAPRAGRRLRRRRAARAPPSSRPTRSSRTSCSPATGPAPALRADVRPLRRRLPRATLRAWFRAAGSPIPGRIGWSSPGRLDSPDGAERG